MYFLNYITATNRYVFAIILSYKSRGNYTVNIITTSEYLFNNKAVLWQENRTMPL